MFPNETVNLSRGHTRLEGRQGGGGYGAASGQHGE